MIGFLVSSPGSRPNKWSLVLPQRGVKQAKDITLPNFANETEPTRWPRSDCLDEMGHGRVLKLEARIRSIRSTGPARPFWLIEK